MSEWAYIDEEKDEDEWEYINDISQPEPEKATPSQIGLHLAKSIGRAGVDILETPYNIEQLVDTGMKFAGTNGIQDLAKNIGLGQAVRSIGRGIGKEEEADNLVSSAINMMGLDAPVSTEPYTKVIADKIGGAGTYDSLKQTIAGEEITREQSPGFYTLGKGLEYAAGGIPNAARNIGKKIASNFSDVAAPVNSLARSVAPDLVVGGAVMAGDAADSLLTDGDPTGLGEFAALPAALLSGRVGASQLSKNQSEVVTFINENASDPAQALARLRIAIANNEEGSLGALTGDQGILDVEKTLAGANKNFRRNLDDSDQALQAQVAENITGNPDNIDPALAAQAAGQRVQQVKDSGAARTSALILAAENETKLANEAAENAQRIAFDQQQPIRTSDTSVEASKQLYSAYEEAELELRQIENTAWDEFRNATDELSTTPIKQSVANLEENWNSINPNELNDFKSKHGKLFDVKSFVEEIELPENMLVGLDGKPLRPVTPPKSTITPQDFAAWQSEINRRIEINVKPNGAPTREGAMLIQLRDATREGLSNTNKGGSELYENARTATKNRYSQLEPGAVGKARQSSSPETLGSNLIKPNDMGAQLMREITESQNPLIINKAINFLKTQIPEIGITPEFMTKYRGLIDNLPVANKAQFTLAASRAADSVEAQRLSQAAQEAKETEIKRIKRNQEGLTNTASANIINKYNENSASTIDRLMGNADNKNELTLLARFMRENDKMDSFVADIKTRLRNKYFVSSEGATTSSAKSIKKFETDIDNLVEGKALTPAEATKMKLEMKRTLPLEQRKASIDFKLDGKSNESTSILSSVLSWLTLNVVGGNATSSLLLGGALRRNYQKMLKGKEVSETDATRAMEELLLNPEKFIRSVDQFKDINSAVSALTTRAVAYSQNLANLTNQGDEDAKR